jgi:hypothetical protein
MTATIAERRFRIAQQLRLFLRSIERNAADYGTIPATQRAQLDNLIQLARQIADQYAPDRTRRVAK